MADGYRIGAEIFPLQGHSAPTDLRNATNRRDLEPIPALLVAWRDYVPRYQVPVFSGERSWKFPATRLP